MENRNFQLDTEWNVIHYPHQPNGFGILIIGDERNFVDKESNFWTQNERRLSLINQFKESGYISFYSNLYGKNWGSDKAVKLAKQLYDFLIRKEILNKKIHLIAEGMGTLVALKLIEGMGQKIRSVVLMNPIFSLKDQLAHEKEHKFFYKKLLVEIASANEMDYREVEEKFLNLDIQPVYSTDSPLKIIHVLSGNRSYKQSKISNKLVTEWKKEGKDVSISYMLPEKMDQLKSDVTNFFKSNEKVL